MESINEKDAKKKRKKAVTEGNKDEIKINIQIPIPGGTYPDILEPEIEKEIEKDKTKQLDLEDNYQRPKYKITELCKDIREYWIKNYLIKDIDMIDIPLAVAITHMLPGDPVWLFMVAQSSSLKSEIARSFGEIENKYVHTSSKLTENAILSGSYDEDSLAERLNGKLWIFKDLTTLLGMRPERLEVVAGTMREMYDGYITLDSGKLKDSKNIKVHVTLIAGVTPDVIDGRSKLFKAEVGERVIHKRFKYFDKDDSSKLLEFLEESEFKSNKKRKEINIKMDILLEEIFKQKEIYDNSDYDIKIKNKDTQKILMDLAIFLAKMRISVHWSYNQKEIEDIGTQEGPARLYLQLKKLAAALKIVKDRPEIDSIVISSIVKVIMDTMPYKRFVCLLPFIVNWKENNGIENIKILDYTKVVHEISNSTARRRLEELEEMNILTKSNPNASNPNTSNPSTNLETDVDKEKEIEKEINKQDSVLNLMNKQFGVKSDAYIGANSWYLTKEFIRDYEPILNKICDIYKDEYVPIH